MGLFHACGQGLAVHGEPVVHRCDFYLAGFQVFHGVVCTVMAVVHFDRARAKGQRQHLMTKTDAKDRQVGLVEDVFDQLQSDSFSIKILYFVDYNMLRKKN